MTIQATAIEQFFSALWRHARYMARHGRALGAPGPFNVGLTIRFEILDRIDANAELDQIECHAGFELGRLRARVKN